MGGTVDGAIAARAHQLAIRRPDRANYRMLGVADLARSLGNGTAPRASGELALHVLEILEGILRAGETGDTVALPESTIRPASLSEADAATLQDR